MNTRHIKDKMEIDDIYEVFDKMDLSIITPPTIEELKPLQIEDNWSKYAKYILWLEEKISECDKTEKNNEVLKYLRNLIKDNLKLDDMI